MSGPEEYEDDMDRAYLHIEKQKRRIATLEAENERLREALRIDGEQHATHIKALEEEHRVRLDAYAAEIERLRETLVFYADDSNYAPRFDGKWHDSSIETDRGAKARAALSPKGGEHGTT